MMKIATLRWHGVENRMPPIAATTPMLMAFDGSHVWAGAANSVKKIRPADGVVVGSYALTDNSYGVTYDGYSVWVGLSNGSAIYRIDPVGTSTRFATSFSAMYGLGFDGNRVWAALGSDHKVAAFDNAGVPVVVASTGAGSFPTGIAFDGTHIWVAAHNSNQVRKINPADGATIASYPTPKPHQMAFDGTDMWIANDIAAGTVTRMRAADGTVVGVYNAGVNPQGIVFDGTTIWVSNVLSDTVTRIRVSDGAILGTLPTCGYPFGMVFDVTNVWIGCHTGNQIIKR